MAPYRGALPKQEVALLEERLSGACTVEVEVEAFDEFALLLSDPEKTIAYDDTAPTGHTLRLLELPTAWTGFLQSAPGDVSCLGPLSGLKAARERYEATVRALADPAATALVLVASPTAWRCWKLREPVEGGHQPIGWALTVLVGLDEFKRHLIRARTSTSGSQN